MRAALALAAGLLAWGALANLVLGETAYVVRNLAVGTALVLVARRLDVSWAALGLTRRRLGAGARWGAAAALVVAAAVSVGALLAEHLPGAGALLADERAAAAGGALASQTLWRIPVGTALFEEVAFRGVLLGALLRAGSRRRAVAVSSAVFGLWHVAPTAVALRVNDVAVASPEGLGAMAGAVAATTVAGAAFAGLRLGSGSLLAPILAHWATNASGLLAAAWAGPAA